MRGCVRQGLKHGRGVAKSADGNVYDGEWVNNKKEVRLHLYLPLLREHARFLCRSGRELDV